MDYFRVETVEEAQKLWEKQGEKDIERVVDETNPFLHACSSGNLPLVEWFIDHGFDPKINPLASRGFPFTKAVISGNCAVIDLLLRRGFDINQPTHGMENSALCQAALDENLEMVKCLLAHGVHPDQEGNFGVSPLMHALLNENYPLSKELLQAGANVHHRDEEGFSVMHSCVHTRSLSLLQLLKDYGAKCQEGDNPFSSKTLVEEALDMEYDEKFISLLRSM